MSAECKIRSPCFEMPWFGDCHPWSSLSSKQLQQQWAVSFKHMQRVLQWLLPHVARREEPQEKGKASFQGTWASERARKESSSSHKVEGGWGAQKRMPICREPVHSLPTQLDTGISFPPLYGRGSRFKKVKSPATSHTASEEWRDDLTQMTWMAWEGVWGRKNFPSVLCWSPPTS